MKTSDIHVLTNKIKAEALRLGFSACGVAKAQPVDADYAKNYREWLRRGNHASMQYLENNLDKRLDPTLLMLGAKSIISLALNYYPKQRLADSQYQFAYYAYGKDYHDVMKGKMRELVKFIEELTAFPINASSPPINREDRGCLLCVDTVPILDRYWAQKAGLGWIGKNGNLIIPKAGSYFFLCEVLLDIELEYDVPMESHCGICTKCLDACPSGALYAPYSIDARRCLSYLTIEHRGEFETGTEADIKKSAGNYIYGCDCCQKACPYNSFATPTDVVEFTPSMEFLSMRPSDWHQLTVEQYRSLFKGSAVKRAKYEGLLRNITLQK